MLAMLEQSPSHQIAQRLLLRNHPLAAVVGKPGMRPIDENICSSHRFAVQLDAHGVLAGRVQRKIDNGYDWQVHLQGGSRTSLDAQLAARIPEFHVTRINPVKGQAMGARIFRRRFHSHHEMRTGMHSRESTNMKRVEDSENVELSFLRKICCVGEYRE